MGSRTHTPITVPDQDDPTTMIVVGYRTDDTRNLADAIAETLGRLALQYQSLYDAGRNYQGKNFQIDETSLRNINGGASMAMIANAAGQPFSQTWIAADNSTILLDGQAMIAFGLNVGAYVSALVLNNRALKDQIAALTTIADCDAFDVTQGWPAN